METQPYQTIARLDTEISTSQGVCTCTIRRTRYENEFQVELWRGSMFLESQITVFCSCVYFRWTGQRYTIIRRKETLYSNEYWLELERIVGAIIEVNTYP